MHETKLTSEIFWPTHTRLAQSVGWWSRGQGFNPDWVQCLMNFFCFFLCRDLSDNRTETRIVKTRMYLLLFVRNKSCILHVDLSNKFPKQHIMSFRLNIPTIALVKIFWFNMKPRSPQTVDCSNINFHRNQYAVVSVNLLGSYVILCKRIYKYFQ